LRTVVVIASAELSTALYKQSAAEKHSGSARARAPSSGPAALLSPRQEQEQEDTTAARQLLRGRSPFHGEREYMSCSFWRAHALRSKSEEPFPKKKQE
jgi:hypothetical protein